LRIDLQTEFHIGNRSSSRKKPRNSSCVWNHFKEVEENQKKMNKCTLCLKFFSKQTSTTALYVHLVHIWQMCTRSNYWIIVMKQQQRVVLIQRTRHQFHSKQELRVELNMEKNSKSYSMKSCCALLSVISRRLTYVKALRWTENGQCPIVTQYEKDSMTNTISEYGIFCSRSNRFSHSTHSSLSRQLYSKSICFKSTKKYPIIIRTFL